MTSINNYRFGSYAILAMGLINLQYQVGSSNNLIKSLVLILVGLTTLSVTFVPLFKKILTKKYIEKGALVLLLLLIVYGFLI